MKKTIKLGILLLVMGINLGLGWGSVQAAVYRKCTATGTQGTQCLELDRDEAYVERNGTPIVIKCGKDRYSDSTCTTLIPAIQTGEVTGVQTGGPAVQTGTTGQPAVEPVKNEPAKEEAQPTIPKKTVYEANNPFGEIMPPPIVGYGNLDNGGPTNFVSAVINFMTAVAAVWLLITIIWAGITVIKGAKSPEDFYKGLQRIMWAAIGMVLVVFAYVIASVIMTALTGDNAAIDDPLSIFR